MTYRHRALGALSRVELLDMGQALGVPLDRGMSLDEMRLIAAETAEARLEDILPRLPRATLKAVCDALGLDRTGRDKETLVERILRGHHSASERDRGDRSAAA